MTDREAPESLEAACLTFSSFLLQSGYPERVRWVEQFDVLWDRSQILVRPRLTQETWKAASKKYATGIERGHGIALYAFSALADLTIATILVPRNEDEAERSLTPCGGLKMSAAATKPPVREIAGQLAWLILSIWYRSPSQLFRTNYLELD